MKNLISMTDFVLEQYEQIQESNVFENNCVKYAKFLKQPLELWMFVACDEDGNVLDKPYAGMFGYDHVYNNYNKAKERVLFDGVNEIQASIVLQSMALPI